MNRDPASTQPVLTEPLPKRETSFRAAQSPLSVAATLPVGATEPAGPAMTEPALPLVTEPAPASLLENPALPAAESLAELDRLSAILEEEIRRSGSRSSAAALPPAATASTEEESLQTYLDRFMERVTGKKVEAPAPIADVAAEAPIAAPAAPVRLPDLAPPSPREPARAPECRETLSAMRDLANENARVAVNTHAGRHQWRRTRLNFYLAVAATTTSSALAAAHLATSARDTAESAAWIGLIAVYLTCRFFWGSRQLAALL